MKKADLVSIVTPTYNSEDFIMGTIECVVAQTYQNWEMLIVDDCSSDSTVDLIRKYIDENNENRIRFFQNEKNEGAAYSRNLAIREARGRWVAFLDSDDIWLPEKLEKQLKFMKENGYAFSYTEYEEFNCRVGKVDKYITGPKNISAYLMRKYCWVGCLTVMYDADVVGLIQIDPKLGNGTNDYPMWLKIIDSADCHLLKECLSIYRRREGSISDRSYLKLITYLYRGYKSTYNSSKMKTAWLTFNSLVFGVLKKMLFVKPICNSLNEKIIYNSNLRTGGGATS